MRILKYKLFSLHVYIVREPLDEKDLMDNSLQGM